MELELHLEANVLGPVDLEIRPVVRFEAPKISADLERRWRPAPLPRGVMRFRQFLRSARMKMALSLREASRLSERISAELEDERCFMSASALSDYEAGDSIPSATAFSWLYSMTRFWLKNPKVCFEGVAVSPMIEASKYSSTWRQRL